MRPLSILIPGVAFTTSGERRASRKNSYFFTRSGKSQPMVAAFTTI
jgi:hypothetical protein